jgi:hypothetical protein
MVKWEGASRVVKLCRVTNEKPLRSSFWFKGCPLFRERDKVDVKQQQA